ncbi:MAG: phage tail protein [Clostridiales bacterium]|nr:phage tail protein [Clostridiales bacterium]
MATIGMDKLFYAKITEGENGEETYGPPISLAKALSADLTIELAEATLFADDSAAYVIKDFRSGSLSLGVDDIGVTAAQDLTGAVVDDNGVLISASENDGLPVAIGFRALKPDNRYRYFWLYRVKFGIPATNLQTNGESITFQTPTIEGTVMRRNKLDGNGKHPWKAEVTEGDPGVSADTISNWYEQVYEPVYSANPEIGG